MDAPFDFNMNRREVLFMKPYANGVLTHACCTCWHRSESDENVARHMASVVLAGVPAVSVDLVTVPESHRRIIRSWLGFYNQHRDELLHGKMSPLAFFPAAGALSITGKTRNYIGLFETVPPLIELPEPRNEIYLVNCTGERLVTQSRELARPVFLQDLQPPSGGRAGIGPSRGWGVAPGREIASPFLMEVRRA